MPHKHADKLYINNIVEEELNIFNNTIDTDIELLTETIEEGFAGDAFKKLKDIGKAILKKIIDAIKKFFTNIFGKIIKKLKEYAKKGMTALSEVLGITIDGSSTLVINF